MRRAAGVVFMLALACVLWLTPRSSINTKSMFPESEDEPVILKARRRLPKLTLMHVAHITECAKMSFSYYTIDMFFPRSLGVSNIALLDEEEPRDHSLGKCLEELGDRFTLTTKTYKKRLPWPQFLEGSRSDRGQGYDRQQWETFYLDEYTDAELIGVYDSDTTFFSPPTPENILDDQGRIKVLARTEDNWGPTTTFALDLPAIADVMGIDRFPVWINRSTFAAVRKHLALRFGARSFDEAFVKLMTTNPAYSQFNIIMNYALHMEQHLYSFHMRAPRLGTTGESMFNRNYMTYDVLHDIGCNGIKPQEVKRGCCTVFPGLKGCDRVLAEAGRVVTPLYFACGRMCINDHHQDVMNVLKNQADPKDVERMKMLCQRDLSVGFQPAFSPLLKCCPPGLTASTHTEWKKRKSNVRRFVGRALTGASRQAGAASRTFRGRGVAGNSDLPLNGTARAGWLGNKAQKSRLALPVLASSRRFDQMRIRRSTLTQNRTQTKSVVGRLLLRNLNIGDTRA